MTVMPESNASLPVVQLTTNAAAEYRALLALPENTGKVVRFYVEQGGCSGMQYGMTLDEKREGDLVSEQSGVTVVVDSISAEFLRGTEVDYSDALSGGGFKIRNPNARESCGCGKSFTT